jgi:hypothetical protein
LLLGYRLNPKLMLITRNTTDARSLVVVMPPPRALAPSRVTKTPQNGL